jgi:hypothetical protein
VNDFIEECVQFPNGAHDDQVDAMTQALLRWLAAPQHMTVYYNPPAEVNEYEAMVRSLGFIL